MTTLLRLTLAALALAALLYAAILALLWFGQERLIFQPEPLPADAVLARDPDVHERVVAVDGARLSVLELRCPTRRAWCSSCTATPATWRAGSSTPTSTAAPATTS